MNGKKQLSSLATLIWFFTSAAAIGRPVPAPLDISALKMKAGIIYVGTGLRLVEETEHVATLDRYEFRGRKKTMAFRIERVIRGADVKVINVEFFSPDRDMPEFAPLTVGKRYLLFLKAPKESGEKYSLVDATSGALIVPGPLPKDLKPDATCDERIASELFGAVLDIDPAVAVPAIRLVARLGQTSELGIASGKCLDVLRETSKRESPEIAFASIAARIVLGDSAALDELHTLTQVASVPSTAFQMRSVFLDVDSALSGSLKPECLTGLIKLCRNQDVGLRKLASYALRQLENADKIPALAKLLNDADPAIQYNAMMGLALAGGRAEHIVNEYAPSKRLFEENPEKYLSYWRKWWEENKKNYPKAP